MFCPNCTAQNVDDAKHCRMCGAYLALVIYALVGKLPRLEVSTPQPDKSNPLYCPKCATKNSNDANYCRACGVPIAGVWEAMAQDPSQPEEQVFEQESIALTLTDGKIKLVALSPDGTYTYLDGLQNLHHIIYVTSSETLALESAVEELEALMNSQSAKEQDFQTFFERNPNFILNDEYKAAHSHIVLTKDEGETLIPDFVLEPIEQNSLCDLLELKLPSAQVFVLQKRRMRFSAAVLEACAQLREYSAFFEEERHRNSIQQKYGLLSYKPKMIVVIGRRGKINPIEVRRIENDLANLHLRTYDDIISRMKHKILTMKGKR